MLIITWDTKLKSESVEKKNQSSKELPYQDIKVVKKYTYTIAYFKTQIGV